jgi:hypothetical protein
MANPYGMTLTPPRLIPAHFDDSHIRARAGTQRMAFDALDNSGVIGANEKLAQVQAHTAEASAGILEEEATRQRYAREERMAKEEERRNFVRGELDKARKLSEEAGKASVDPGRFFKSPGAIMMAIGAVLRPGNEGMAMFERAIERDLALQKDEIALKRQRGQEAYNTLAKYQAAFGDERAAELAFEADARDVGRTKLMALGTRSQSPQLMANAQVMSEQLKQSASGARANLAMHFDNQAYVGPQVVGGYSGPAKQEGLFVPLGPDGRGFYAKSEEEAKKGRGLAYAQQNIIPKLNRLKELRKQTTSTIRGAGKLGYEPKSLAEIKSLEAQVAMEIGSLQANSPGALDEGMLRVAKAVQGDWTSVGGHPEAAADAFIGTINSQLSNFQRGQAGQTSVQTIAPDNKGGVTTKTVGQAQFSSPVDYKDPGTFKLMQPQVGKR